MVIFTRASGKMERLMGLGFLLIPTALCMREIGSTISNMGREQNHGILIRLNTQATSKTAKKQATADSNSKVATTRASSKTANLKAKALITFLTVVKYTRVISKTTIWMDMG